MWLQIRLIVAVALVLLLGVHAAAPHQDQGSSSPAASARKDFLASAHTLRLGQDALDFLTMTNSTKGSASSRRLFMLGLASFHNFWFEVADEFFAEAAADTDPYPMAAWYGALYLSPLPWKSTHCMLHGALYLSSLPWMSTHCMLHVTFSPLPWKSTCCMLHATSLLRHGSPPIACCMLHVTSLLCHGSPPGLCYMLPLSSAVEVHLFTTCVPMTNVCS